MRPVVVAERAGSEATAFSPELSALIACARAVLDGGRLDELLQALKECPSAERLCEMAIAERMLGHLHRLVVRDEAISVDSALTRRLTELQRASALRNLRQTAQLLRLLDELRAAGVRAMAYKGPLWAELLYGDIGLRSWSDLDLLVAHDQLPKAREVLLSIGFRDSVRSNPKIMQRDHGSLGQVALSCQDAGLNVELHWEVTAGLSPHSLSSGMLLARACEAEILGRRLLRPGETDMLLMTCLDGTRDRWDNLEKLLGVAVQMCRLSLDGWAATLEAAKANSCLRRLSIALMRTSRVIGLQVDERIVSSLAGDRLTQALTRSLRLSERPYACAPARCDGLAGKLWITRSEDSYGAVTRHAAARLFQPGPADWQAVTLPPVLGWLYYPFRPARLAAKLIKASMVPDLAARRSRNRS